MTQPSHPNLARAIAIAQRDHLQPIPATRQDTGEQVWFLQSRSDPSRYYVLTKANGAIRCGCSQYQYQEMCAHVAAILVLHQFHQPTGPSESAASPLSTEQLLPPHIPAQSRQVREQQYRQEARRREEALLWTDDKPFSMWKS